MATMAKALPSYAWLTALPQLISRICHNNPEINTVTNHIITHVAEAYPQQVRQLYGCKLDTNLSLTVLTAQVKGHLLSHAQETQSCWRCTSYVTLQLAAVSSAKTSVLLQLLLNMSSIPKL